MRLFDSHCHIDDKSYNKDREEVIKRALDEDVKASMVVGVTLESSIKAVEIAEANNDIYASVGIHPHYAESFNDKILNELLALSEKNSVKAWGETGLDFNRMFSPVKDQEECLRIQLETADKKNLPLIFHERDSKGRFLEILKETHNSNRRGVIHCFSGNSDEMKEYLELGYYIGITGIVTIMKRGENLRKLLPQIPKDKILVETDAPYLTPAPQKNKFRRNEPAFVKSTFLKVSEILGEDDESFSEKIWENTTKLFGI